MFGLTPYERKNSAMTYDPFKAFENFEREFFKTNGLAEFKTDIRDNGKEYELEADLPGFKKDEIKVDLKDGYLTISAEKNLNRDEKDQKGNYIRQERCTGACSRSFYVGDIRPEHITAKYEDGILQLSMPKVEKKELPSGSSIAIN